MQIQGHFELKFEAVREAFAALFDDPQERGGALCIQIGGETVLDLWTGTADRDGAEAWHSDTIANLFSCTKTFTAVTALQLVGEGKLSLDEPVAKLWPEFAAAGKEKITLRQFLCHQAGLPALRYIMPAEALYDWQAMTDALAAEEPWWAPGHGHGYAAITYGWLVGELLLRADGRGPGESIVARIARPLGLDFHVGLADEEFHRVAYIARGKGSVGDEAAQRLLHAVMREPTSMTARAFTNPPSIMTSTNKPEWRRMQQPAANGHGNARSLAGFYSGLLDGRLLEAELLGELTREHSVGHDKTLLTQTRFGLGCMLDQPHVPNATFGLGPKAFGHPGAGGSVGFADPEREVAFGFVTNTLGPYVLMDPRAQKLARVLGECV
ncbi:serine hydrolase domain-containing protein [Pseudomonas sp. MH9.2]|mgnify:CR=1 FL=1|uniref:serine hydrolase domain-containing protein n=1 Tax=unclassified Pseudomonas TaxID=196821 RepID=UPI002AC8FFD7|nr:MULTISPECIES: serine hydrolase domain-containing protein [unclassified Pseudomonas]MEB0005714.1 serine hydrolase domain-containing protein [Pseudomonas sp. RTB2]MEB0016766.1 serine hydrolase domain-containing protein [Pseudomonas sp. RTB3]MEB0024712.1 serine hydrolase domain-containing protein [Pseudomonas sp. MH9.2]MEB0146388.1 serine hydrolase domain-containing protein [Pseudomonas sp. CCC2.2]MEB0268226.1 serine hydrolase domain-containing protein [Pseudomonas sp. 5B4]